MYHLGKQSRSEYNTLHGDLQRIVDRTILFVDFTITRGFRSESLQNKAFNNGASQVVWPYSKHNSTPSLALDYVPFIPNYGPIQGNKIQIALLAKAQGITVDEAYNKICNQFCYIAGHMKQVANELKLQVVWGGDWAGENNQLINRFDDLGHIELSGAKYDGKYKRECSDNNGNTG